MSGFQVDKVNDLLEWCAANDIFIDSRIRIASDDRGNICVHSTDHLIPPKATLVKIAKDAVLSVRNCSLARLIPFNPYGRGAQLSLSIALYVEILRGTQSRWHGYLQSLPGGIVDLPLFWSTDVDKTKDSAEALAWLGGTEAARILSTRSENRTTLEEINHFYRNVAEPLFLHHVHAWQCGVASSTPTIMGFYRAFSLVSSRAFLVDAYHGLSMVPIADAFNHALENHVHLESDYSVCSECGSLQECLHDRDQQSGDDDKMPKNLSQDDDHDSFYEMVTNAGTPPLSEVFNTYGEDLTNAQLLNQYGFILDVNDNDRLSWTMHEILDLFLPNDTTETDRGDITGHFHETLSRLDETRPIFAHSRLIYYEVSDGHHFYLNCEGSLSHQLWAILFVLSARRHQGVIADRDAHQTPNAVLELQMQMETPDSDDEDGMGVGKPLGKTPDFLPLRILHDLCEMTMALCTERKHNIGKSGSSQLELSSVVEEIPEDNVRTHLAISFLMSERSMLDCCEAEWRELTEFMFPLLNGLG
ncbi:hypothetical protein GALMADRAFT_140168 [Galerina marginata CBS 339.88]|uniref:SET domain-containing protein n=1 Tax=Galerina marginata (strain CBS 339.88) TaxID=685588 RepID=A0A067SXC0_GALM3|nr:hypothetical protein GALMADRAFT_140168 [Galerina marginata CBS 339.88]